MKRIAFILLVVLAHFVNAQHIEVDATDKNERTSWIFSTCFFNDKTIAFCGTDNSVHLINLKKLEVSKSFTGLESVPYNFAVSNNRKWIVACSEDEDIRLWNAKTGELKHRCGNGALGFGAPKYLCFAPDDLTFAVDRSCDFQIWSTETGTITDSIKPCNNNECNYLVTYTADGTKAYCGGNDNVWLYNLKDKKVETVKDVDAISVVNDIAISPDKEQVAVAGREGILILNKDLSDKLKLKGEPDWQKDIVYSPDGKYLYSAGGSFLKNDYSVKKWDLTTGECIISANGHTDCIQSIDISGNGRFILTGSRDGSIKIWSSSELKLICTIEPLKVAGKIKLFCYTPDGTIYGPEEFLESHTVKMNGNAFKPKDLQSTTECRKIVKKLK